MSSYPNPNGNQQHSLAHLNWGLLIFLYFVWWPIGLILTILKIIDMQAEKNEQMGRQNWINQLNGQPYQYGSYNYNTSYRAWTGTTPNGVPQPNAQNPVQPGMQGTTRPNPQGTAQPNMQNPAQPHAAPFYTAAGRAAYTPPVNSAYQPMQATQIQQKAARRQRISIALLSILSAGALIIGVPELISVVGYVGMGLSVGYVLSTLVSALVKIVGGVGLGFFAAHLNRSRRCEKVLSTIVGTRNSVSLRELSAASGYDSKKTLQLAQDAINHGLFGPYSYIDMSTQTLVVRGAPPKAEKPKQAAPAKDENKYQAILRQLREANDRIPGEEMSAKISQLETLSARIFELAEKDPEKKPQLNKFMDYYLPTALKLLNTYATLDQQGMQGQNISETKASIENAMDMLVKAFAAQLDKLFQNDALDVSGDIAALQSMMSMDGLTGTDFNASNPFDTKPSGPSDGTK
jgi:hypothetical protein